MPVNIHSKITLREVFFFFSETPKITVANWQIVGSVCEKNRDWNPRLHIRLTSASSHRINNDSMEYVESPTDSELTP